MSVFEDNNNEKDKKNPAFENDDDAIIDDDEIEEEFDESLSIPINSSKPETLRINQGKKKIGFSTDKIQDLDELGDPDDFEFDLEIAHKKDKEKEAEILALDRDVQNGDEIEEYQERSSFSVGDIGDEADIDILPMILKRNSQMQKKYDIDDLKDIKIDIKKK